MKKVIIILMLDGRPFQLILNGHDCRIVWCDILFSAEEPEKMHSHVVQCALSHSNVRVWLCGAVCAGRYVPH